MATNLAHGSAADIDWMVGPASTTRLIGRRHTEGVMEMLQVAQHADDLDRARDFYTRLLGAEPSGFFDPPGLLFFRAGSVRLLLEQGTPSALIYLKVDDLDATVEALRADGDRKS